MSGVGKSVNDANRSDSLLNLRDASPGWRSRLEHDFEGHVLAPEIQTVECLKGQPELGAWGA